MSAIAEFILLPNSALAGLPKAASTSDAYWAYLRANGQIAAQYGWSGYVFATLLPYLDEHNHIDLLHSEYDELAQLLDKTVGLLHVFLTSAQKRAYLSQLDPRAFSELELRDYFNHFNAVNEPAIGRAMIDGIACLQQCLSRLDDQSVVLVSVE